MVNSHLRIPLVAICVFLLFCPLVAFGGEAPEIEWSKILGGPSYNELYSIEQTTDGGYIMAGSTYSKLSEKGYGWLVKTNSKGVMEWEKNTLGFNGDNINSVQETTDGGYILAGEGNVSAAGLGRRGDYNVSARLIKTDSKGVVEWNITRPNCTLSSVQQASDGGYVAAGENKFAGGWLIKIDSKGATEWERIFGSPDYLSQIQQTKDGGYIGVGGCLNYTWLVKTDSMGVRDWEKSFSKSDLRLDFISLSSVQETTDGGYIAAGISEEYPSMGRSVDVLLLIKTDSKGVLEWEKTFKGGVSDVSVEQTTDGGYIIATTDSEYITAGSQGEKDADWLFKGWLIKTDSSGAKEWQKIFYGPHSCNLKSVKQTADGGYISVGGKQMEKAGEWNGLLIKLKGQNR